MWYRALPHHGEFSRNASFWVQLRPPESETLRVGPEILPGDTNMCLSLRIFDIEEAWSYSVLKNKGSADSTSTRGENEKSSREAEQRRRKVRGMQDGGGGQ